MPICRLQIPPSTSCLSVSHLKEGLYYIWTRQGFLHCSPCPLSSNGQSDLIDPLLWLPSLDVSPPPPFASVCHIIIRGLVDEFGFSFSFSTVILFNVVPTYTILISLLSVPSPPPTYCRSHPDPTPYLHISTIHRLTHNSPPHTPPAHPIAFPFGHGFRIVSSNDLIYAPGFVLSFLVPDYVVCWFLPPTFFFLCRIGQLKYTIWN